MTSHIEARIAMVSCYGYLLFIHSSEPDRVKEIFTQVGPITAEVKQKAADNPRRRLLRIAAGEFP